MANLEIILLTIIPHLPELIRIGLTITIGLENIVSTCCYGMTIKI